MWLLSKSQESRMMARFWSSWNAGVAFICDGDDGKNGRLLTRSPRGLCGGSWTSRPGWQGRSLFWRVNGGLSVRITFEAMRLDEIAMAGEKQQTEKAKA